jgi:peroxidase
MVYANTFGELKNLEMLSLQENQIAAIDQTAFKGLVSLKYLYMSNNKLTFILPNTFSELKNLAKLKLDHNQIVIIHPDAFKGLGSLKQLFINNNSYSDFIYNNTFAELKSLTKLNIDGEGSWWWDQAGIIDSLKVNRGYDWELCAGSY